MASVDVAAIRAQIPATQAVVYLNTGWAGPSPRPVVEAISRALEEHSFGGPTTPPLLEQRLELLQQARQAVADLLGATADEISLQQNTTEGINIVLNGLDLSPGDELITCDMEHTSVIIPCYYARDRRRLNLKIVQLDAADSPAQIVDKFAQAISPRTRLFVLSHVSFSSGLLLPLKEINQLAHSAPGRALVLADGAQAVGQMPVDVVDLECDFYALPGHKWLLGPAGTGALYIRRDLIEGLPPPKVAHRASHSFTYTGHYEPRTDAIDKFELTTVSIPLLVGLAEAITFLRRLGLEAIQERVRALADRARAGLSAIPPVKLVSPASGPLATGLVSFAIPGLVPQDVTAALWELERIVGRTVYENGSTRLSIDFFNTEEEVETTLNIVRRLARRGLPQGLPARQQGALPSVTRELTAFWEL
ncbi:MAG: aminotransferase class V-fold PLP-dependent enzyme [Chloroflexota bacterium]|nr:aminotransferase class V-fold PLP-dependent enzyme [Chloroflexota bacterium]